jgi:hypothetical protein
MSCERGDRNDHRQQRGGCHDSSDRFRDDCYREPHHNRREVIIIQQGGHCGPERPYAPLPPLPPFRPGGHCDDRRGFGPPVLIPPRPPVVFFPNNGGCFPERGGCFEPQPYPMPRPYQRSGGEWFERGPSYSRDDVSGGAGGYRSSRERYDGGYQYGRQGGYEQYNRQPSYSYDYDIYQPQPQPYYSQGGQYNRDSVSGGAGGYRASRERYDGGYSGNGGYNGNGGDFWGGRSPVDGIADLGFGVWDRINARDATRWANRR